MTTWLLEVVMCAAVGYGLIGSGSFGQFCLEQYRSLPEVKLVAVTDFDTALASRVGQRFNMRACTSAEQLLKDPEVQLVHLATPPGTHYELTMMALRAGKHVLCEKPLATLLSNAGEMIAMARSAGLILAVNLIMRYDPLTVAVQKIMNGRLMGEPIRALFENYAQDQRLPPNHWFWKRDRSGGIFIEHAVHFFDLFESWLGPGEVFSAQEVRRPGTVDQIDQVQCICRYGRGVLASFYHGFHQSDRMDRQEFRIVCERGEINLYEWLPTRVRVDAALQEREASAIADVLPNARATRIQDASALGRKVHSHDKDYEVDGRYIIEAGAGMPKLELYGQVLRDLLADQVQAIRNPAHKRRIDESNGLRSLQMAVAATELAAAGSKGSGK